MRELKFRIWIKDEKRYYDESDEESYMIVPNGNVTYTSESYEEDGVWFNDTTRATNDVIVEQYTGLKDKNGKEIYEGDIVTPNGEWEEIEGTDCSVILFENGCFRVGSGCENEAGRYLSDWRVVGNVHENDNLLEGK